MKKLLIILLFVNFIAQGQNVSISINAPSAVEVGEQFQINYTVNAEVSGFENTTFPDFDLLGGPQQGLSRSSSFINGKVSNEIKHSFTYILRGKKVGKFTISPIGVVVDGKRYKSKSIVIEVVASSNGSAASSRNKNSNNDDSRNAAGSTGSGETFGGIFSSKSTIYQGEPILVSLKVFSTNEIVDIPDFKESNFNGFYKNTVDIGQLKLTQERYDGKAYYSVLLQKNILFAQQSGDLSLSGFSLSPVVRTYKTRKAASQVEAFMYGSNTIKEPMNSQVKIKSPNLKIKVLPLPDAGKPDGFNGTVGIYEIKTTVDRTTLNANDAFTYKITITGKGNIELLDVPKPEFHPDFEVYDPKVSTNIDVSVAGVNGSKTFEYLVIPRTEGNYNIPPLVFSFFNYEKKKYETKIAEGYQIKVGKGSGSAMISGGNMVESQEVKYLNQDIRYIITSNQRFQRTGMFMFNSLIHWILLVIIPLFTFAGIYLMRKRMRENLDVFAVKNRRASKVAMKRLKTAKRFLDQNKEMEFYDEISRVLWGYFGDKFSIVLSELSVENVKLELNARGLKSDIAEEVGLLLEECEFARFAPTRSGNTLSDIYSRASEIITRTEKIVK